MDQRAKRDKPSSAIDRLAEHAMDAVEAGDRWLVGFASDLGSVGFWTKRQASIVADSFVAALDTTARITRNVTRRNRPRDEELGVAAFETSPEADRSVIPDSPLSESPTPPEWNKLDLLTATDDAPSGSSSPADEANSDSVRAEYSPGVLPILQALERVVNEHSESDRRSLDRDSRFWKLIQLLHLLNPPRRAPQTAASESTQPTAEGVMR
jgi:hypothetical protein